MLNKEIELIQNQVLKNDVKLILSKVPQYFWEIPASSTGKFHPKFSLGEGGLIKHVKTAIKFAIELFPIYNFEQIEQDMIIAALLLHDCLKHGYDKSEFSQFEHPIYMYYFIEELMKELEGPNDIWNIIREAILSHMGKWNTNNYSTKELPLPYTELQKFVHLCDYLSSRKFYNIEFKDNEILE